jgi:hypothetical protein
VYILLIYSTEAQSRVSTQNVSFITSDYRQFTP